MASGDNMRLRRKANSFLIWREGESVRWHCTAGELAEATGLSLNTVPSICKERKWPIQPGDRHGDLARLFGTRHAPEVDREIKITESFLRQLEGSTLEGFEHVPDSD